MDNKQRNRVTLRLTGLVAVGLLAGAVAATQGFAPPNELMPYAQVSKPRAIDYKPKFDSNGKLVRPQGWRDWAYIGTPLTPNDLNKPEAAFPEFHVVYMDPGSYNHYKRTGKFRDGTVLIKELTLVQKNDTTDSDNGSTQESSGRGYFMAEYSGLEAAIKDSKRFADQPGNWAYFSFGHVPEAQYAAATSVEPVANCNACHSENAAEDYVFSQHYPVLRGIKARQR